MADRFNSLGKTKFWLVGFGIITAQLVTISCRKQESATGIDSGDEKMAAAKITEGDQLYAAREDISKARVAVAAYRQAVTADYGNYEAAWKLARASFYVGDHTAVSYTHLTLPTIYSV